jgi:hypothetical protein
MKNINWNNVDWNKKTYALAKELGVSIATVSYHRRNMHHRRHERGEWTINWRGVDWSKPNFEIGNEMLATPSAVANARLRYAPKHLKHGRFIKGAFGKLHVELHHRSPQLPEATYPPIIIIESPVPTPKLGNPKPSLIRRLLTRLSNWLFNLSITVEREANK